MNCNMVRLKSTQVCVAILLALFATVAEAAPLVLAGSQSSAPPAYWDTSFYPLGPTIDRAFPFTVIAGGPYRVDQLQTPAFHYPNLAGNVVDFSIHRDDGGRPGALVGAFRFNVSTTVQMLSGAPLGEIVLESATPYWLLGSSPRGQVNWNLANSVFGRTVYRLRSDPWIVQEGTNVAAFAILGSPVPEPGSIVLIIAGLFSSLICSRRSPTTIIDLNSKLLEGHDD
jgi:hypothetical protein